MVVCQCIEHRYMSNLRADSVLAYLGQLISRKQYTLADVNNVITN